MEKSNEVAIIKNSKCLNCELPFQGHELFCPKCGQKNKGSKISIGSFLNEIFKGFTSWDAKFWKTIIPLLIATGKVSKDYIEGKRTRYTNPFRFYITTSILFFLIVGAQETYQKYKKFNLENSKTGIRNEINRDSLRNVVFMELDKAKKKDSLKIIKKTDSLKAINDSITLKDQVDGLKLSFANSDNIISFVKFQKEHPTMSINDALDSLQVEKTFTNRFWYSRSKIINNLVSNKEENKKFNSYLYSYFPVALLILLPVLALFLKIIYIRRKFNYVEHLIFTFHAQTVCFIILTFLSIIRFFNKIEGLVIIQVFSVLFLIYLYIAMKTFYNQGWFKTLMKFLLTNFIFMVLFAFTIATISVVAFSLY